MKHMHIWIIQNVIIPNIDQNKSKGIEPCYYESAFH